ncbi:ferritin family protein [candidate division KSB1 bacterium]|nr:ferritin family protein [candidate division KSB1 bacterium]
MNDRNLTIGDALTVAINEEIKAYNLYSDLSQKMKNAGSRTMLQELAQQEMGHRLLLENVVDKQKPQQLGLNVPTDSPGIAEFLVVSDLKADATVQEVLIFAIKAEIKAYNFYNDFKKYFKATELEPLFTGLAAEEQGHRVKLERDYEEHFMRDN